MKVSTGFHARRLLRLCAGLLLVLAVATCTDTTGPGSEHAERYVTPIGLLTANPPQIFVGAGDISSCSNNNDAATAALLDNIAGTVFVIGDNVYPNGASSEYTNCYQPTWGRHKARTKPVPGNHDYNTSGASGYYNYFGAAAGTAGQGYYSYDLGQWHIIALNSEISKSPTGPEMQWLRADLAAHPNLCTLAYWHEPLYSSDAGSGSGGKIFSSVQPFWDTLYAYGADLVLNGHRHNYERIAPIKPDGSADPSYGIRTMVAGMGGIGGSTLTNVFPRSEAREGSTFGVLKLYLYDDSYAWKFVPVAGKTYTDSGSTACHPRRGSQPPVPTALGFSVQPSNAGTGATITPAVQVEIRDQFGARVTTANNSITMAIGTNPAGGTLSGTKTVTAANGVATFTDLRIDRVGTGYKLAASASGLTGATSSAFNITAPPVATALNFSVQPSNAVVGTAITPAVKVEVLDQFGARMTTAANSVTLAIGTNPGGGALGGTATVGAVNGVATFPDLTISASGSGYTLSATSSGLTSATSSGFAVTTSAPATITHTLLTAGNVLINQNLYTTASISPAPNTLVTIALLSIRSTATISPIVTGGGMASWTLVASVDFDTLGLPHRRLSIYRAMSPSPGSGPITFKFTNQVANLEWIVSQWDGVDPSGTDGGGAIGQVGSARADATNGLSVALGPLGGANNVVLGAFGVNSQTAVITPGAGYTELSEQPANEGTRGDLQTQWGSQSPSSASWTNLKGGALAIELKARSGP